MKNEVVVIDENSLDWKLIDSVKLKFAVIKYLLLTLSKVIVVNYWLLTLFFFAKNTKKKGIKMENRDDPVD